MATNKTKLLTAEDLLRLNSEGVKGELIRGVLHETVSVGKIHARIAMILGAKLVNHVMPGRLGTVGGTDGGVLVERAPDTVREPDIYYVSAARLPFDDQSDGYLEVVPELVVEIVSPSDSPREVNLKIQMWLDLGVSMALVVRPATQTIILHRPGAPAVTLTGEDVLDGGDVLPGFRLPLSEIFDV